VNWFWVNIPLMVIFFAAVSGIPLWLVFKHPDTAPAGAGAGAGAQRAQRSAQARPAGPRLAAIEAGQVGPRRPVPASLVEPDRVGVAR
jgi:hypothetical protein